MRPDVVMERRGSAHIVVDAKWKRRTGWPLVTDDLYQVMAYACSLGIQRAVLVYPGQCERNWHFPLLRAPLTVEVRTLRVVGRRESCARALTRLGRGLTRSRGIS
jgi:hypothetical protein